TFEFDRNGTVGGANILINVTGHQQLIVPPAGGGLGGEVDGDQFSIDVDVNDAILPVVFEFDADSSSAAGNIPITFDNFTTQDVLADRVATAINGAGLGLTATRPAGGNGVVQIEGITPVTGIDVTNAPTLVNNGASLSQNDLANRIA